SHNTGAPYRTNNAYAGHGINDGLVQRRLSGHLFTGMDVRTESTAGLSGVWAEENTRESLWDAMHRRETFGTSGVWIQVRLFGGWDYGADLVDDPDWVAKAYAGGTPMGGDLPAAPSGATAPTLVVWAVKDRSRAVSTASRSSRAGPGTARASRRSTTWSGPATGSRSRARDRFRRFRAPSISPPPRTPTNMVRPSS
ncbi:MAG: DUF3604 domain-containing protein, partial [Bauldia sp.]|nr:DUF3604 domain-containing protein [Bauldia sp.]